jgi:subtilase family serine protease
VTLFLDHPRGTARPVAALAFAGALLVLGAAPRPAEAPAPVSAHDYRAVCADSVAGHAHCDALVRTDVRPISESALDATPDATVSGYGPSSLQSAYNLVAAAATKGSGETVAVIDAYNDPNANSDLAVYRSHFTLPACTQANGCFTVLGQTGSSTALPANAPASDDWTGEESLDVDMVSAICPLCRIDLVEANSDSDTNLGTAVNTAVALGAKFVSTSYGGPETSTETTDDTLYYDHPGVAVTASAGDGSSIEYPAASRYVTAVGGTTLKAASNARGWTETAWFTTPLSPCSAYETKPTWQTDTGCRHRTDSDVAAVADPDTGVAVYDTYNGNGGWNVYGGTSVSSPIIAAVYALAGNPAAGTTPASYPYAHTGNLYDITANTDPQDSCNPPTYLCSAEPGYDAPTGWGTPDGPTAFAPPAASTAAR